MPSPYFLFEHFAIGYIACPLTSPEDDATVCTGWTTGAMRAVQAPYRSKLDRVSSKTLKEERTLSPQWRRVALPIYLLSVRHQQQRPGALSKAFKAPTTVIHAKGPNYHAACQFSVLFSIFLELTTHPKVRECRAKLL